MKNLKNKIEPIIALVVLCALIVTMAMLGENSKTESTIAKTTETTVVEKEVIDEPKEQEFKHIQTAELILDTVEVGAKNNYYSAFLKSYTNDEATVSFNIDTDMPIDSCYYEIVDENGNVVHTDKLGLSMGSSGGNNYQFALNKFVFVNNEEETTNLKPGWQFLGFRFNILSGLDTSIIVEPKIFKK